MIAKCTYVSSLLYCYNLSEFHLIFFGHRNISNQTAHFCFFPLLEYELHILTVSYYMSHKPDVLYHVLLLNRKHRRLDLQLISVEFVLGMLLS